MNDRYLLRAEQRCIAWINLLNHKSFPKEEMPIPPLDACLICHAHYLSPLRYYEDMLRLHDPQAHNYNFPLAKLARHLEEYSQQIWHEYTKKPWELPYPYLRSMRINTEVKSIQIAESSRKNERLKRQRDFTNKMDYMGSLFVPTLDIDLAWHTHILHPLLYRNFTIKHMGRVINHDDTLAEKTLTDGFTKTSQAWYKKYRESYRTLLSLILVAELDVGVSELLITIVAVDVEESETNLYL
ncbi:9089_t:CDS:2 [Ambispora leptoticha]|uniref:9089_t:CDS:1 n=1 Tax=Ambispora leptoticha TaxID=144679 RepID=A0A9N8WCI1_9GLOM|nr:9089_t:CDS:2 [Ambispora leptoticha]